MTVTASAPTTRELRWELADQMFCLPVVCFSREYTFDESSMPCEPEGCLAEGDVAYKLVVGHITGTAPLTGVYAERADRAAVLMRELGGTWGGNGCLEQTSYAPAGDHDLDVCSWKSLKQMAASTGVVFPLD